MQMLFVNNHGICTERLRWDFFYSFNVCLCWLPALPMVCAAERIDNASQIQTEPYGNIIND